ncbi:hypothetical protein ACGFX4_36830 [Kitasatospora sp. NPDC048365]|uniref:hypothetical protein n=1 Tax=Kitasatospora sp. NPDC048365 TaxID=3364050 RepID=UPI003711D5F3
MNDDVAALDGETGAPQEWFFCLDHHRVERDYQCPVTSLLGPFPSAEVAGHALQRAEHNNAVYKSDQD